MVALEFYPNMPLQAMIKIFTNNSVNTMLQCYIAMPNEADSKKKKALKKDIKMMALGFSAYVMHTAETIIEPTVVEDNVFITQMFDKFLTAVVTHDQGLKTLRTFICTTYATHCDHLVQFDPITDEDLKDTSLELQGIREVAWRMANWVQTFVKNGIAWTVESIMSAFENHFNRIVEQYCPAAMTCFGWVRNVWGIVRKWLEQAQECMQWILASCKELFAWGMCMLAATCAFGILEKLLIGADLISENFDLVGIFTKSAIIATCCYNLNKLEMEKNTHTMSLIGIVGGCVGSLITSSFGLANGNIPQYSGATLLEGLAKKLSSFCDTTLVSMGKSCQAVNQIATCAGNLKGIAAKIFETIQHFVYTLLGFESKFLRDAALVFGEDIDGWLKDISSMQDAFLQKAYASQDDILKIHALVAKGQRLRTHCISGKKIAPSIIQMVLKGVDVIEKLSREASLQNGRGVRKIPFVVYAQGASRVGKTLVINKLIEDFMEINHLSEESVYSRNMADPFWSGYRRQPIVVIDDFAAIASDPSAEAQMIPLVSSAPCPLNMASLEEKGLHFDSKFIFCSSNFLEVSPESKVRDDTAFRNRRHVLFSVHLDPERQYDSSDFTANQYYKVLEFRGDGYRVVEQLDTYDDLLSYCLTRWERHDAEQEANLVTKKKPIKVNHFDLFGDLLTLSTGMSRMDFSEEEIAKMYKGNTPPGYVYFCYMRGPRPVHVMVDQYGNDNVLFGDYDGEKLLEKQLKYGETMLMRIYAFLKYSSSVNLVVQNHLADLVASDAYDNEFNFKGNLDKAYDAQLIEGVARLHKWQRAALCGMGCIMEKRINNTWCSRLCETVKDSLYTMHTEDIADWPLPIKITVGVTLAALLGAGFWKFFSFLRNSGTGGVFVGNAAAAFTSTFGDAQSRKPNRFDVSQYRYNNVPIRRRVWGEAQYSLEQSAAAIQSKCQAIFRIGGTQAQILMVPGRRFIGFKHFFVHFRHKMRVFIQLDGRGFYHTYDPSNLELIDDSELCVYSSPSLEDIPSSCWDLYCWDAEKDLPSKFEATMMSAKRDSHTGVTVPEWAHLNVEVKRGRFEIQGADYTQVIPMYLEYDAGTVVDDCGSLIVAHIGNRHQVVGMHIAGRDGKKGFAGLLPPLHPCAQAQMAVELMDFYPVEQSVTEGFAHVGELKPGTWIPLPTKTNLEETPKEWHLDTVCTKLPSIISNSDPRLIEYGHEDYDPYMGGIAKYAQPMSNLDDDTLQEVANEIVEEWFECCASDEDFSDTTLSEALNGVEGVQYMDRMPIATSEGFPHILSRSHGEKGKRRFLAGDGETLELIEGTSVHKAYLVLEENISHSVPTLVGIECPKDEKLPARKVVVKPKTRCFTILPMEYNVLVRKKFLKFVRFIMKNRDKLSCQVGINPYSMEWSELAARLLSKGDNILCCDYSSFDGLMSKQMMGIIAGMINKLCKGSKHDISSRTNLLMACCSRLAICKNQVWRVECGIPSGFPLTVICNSILNEILIRYSYKKLLHQFAVPKILGKSFRQMVSLVVYGDDNLISVDGMIKHVFNGENLKSFLATHGVTITDGIDKTSPTLNFRSLGDCDFLKRGFVKRSDCVWDAPEEKESLWGQLHYVSTINLEKQVAYITNLSNVLRELYMHSPQESADLRRKALQTLSWLKGTDLPTIAQIEEFYAIQRSQKLPDMAVDIDMLLQIENMGALVRTSKPPHELEVSTRMKVVDLTKHPFSEKTDDECWFLFNVMYPDSMLPNDCYAYKYTVGEGRGNLPTKYWLNVNIVRYESEFNKRVRKALAEKKKIVFAYREAFMPVLVMSVLTCARNGMVSTRKVNESLTEAITYCSKLSCLVSECKFVF